MKKALKITGIVIGAVLLLCMIAALVIVLFFPGLDTYLSLNDEYDGLKCVVEEYPSVDAEIPSDFAGFGGKGMKFQAPDTLEVADMDSEQIVYCDSQSDTAVCIFSANTYTVDEFFTESEISRDKWEDFFKDIGREYPSSRYELIDIVFGLTSDDFNIHSKDKAEAFKYLAEIKTEVDFKGLYRIDSENAKGFVIAVNDIDGGGSQWIVKLYPNDDLNEEHTVIVSSSDEDVTRQIVSTIVLS